MQRSIASDLCKLWSGLCEARSLGVIVIGDSNGLQPDGYCNLHAATPAEAMHSQ